MKKKLVSMLLCVTMTASLLVGCGGGSDDTEGKDSGTETQEESTTGGDTTEETTGGDTTEETTGGDTTEESGTEEGDTTEESGTDEGDTSEGDTASADEGKVLNVYCWNPEFKTRVEQAYPGYTAGADNSETDDKGNVSGEAEGTIGDVKVVWHFTPNEDNAYQNNLDEALLAQESAAADDKVDIFLCEADYALKYVNSDYSMPISDLGITDADTADQYQYTKDVVTDSNGVLKALSWQACPGIFFYNREIAKEVFGSDDPATVQEKVKDWPTFNQTAQELHDAGYSIVSSAVDTYRTYQNNVSSPWVVDGKINIDDNLKLWVDDSKALVDAGLVGTMKLWDDDWKLGFFPEGKVFGYFGPAWLVNFSMSAEEEGSVGYNGGWGGTQGPQGYFWGGTWICAATGTDNVNTIKDIMIGLTCTADNMQKIVELDDDFVNNKPLMEGLADESILINDKPYSSKVLGGQNPLPIYCEAVADLKLDNLGEYDQACNEEFQTAMLDYMKGNVDYDQALQNFYDAVVTKHPNLTHD